ncbi:flavodoxin family protein [Halioxenophilus aromaticivorans]|uniref:Flavodoxin n=1 Tax=Halioxenophilus aromaticivorans TaxID=1306992 RepID=A0AAV3U1W7_9ALTE
MWQSISLGFLGQLMALILYSAAINASDSPVANGSSTKGEAPNREKTLKQPMNTAIIYLTRTGNTEAVAKMIQQEIGGDLIELRPAQSYPSDYQAHVDQVDEENDLGFLPPLANDLAGLAQYERLFLGYPTWDMTLPPPFKTLLSQGDFSGKTILPFNTNAGFGAGDSVAVINQLCSDCRVKKALIVEGGYERKGIMLAIQGAREQEVQAQVKDWLKETAGESRP